MKKVWKDKIIKAFEASGVLVFDWV